MQGRYTFERLDPAELSADDPSIEREDDAVALAAEAAAAVDSEEELPDDDAEAADFGFEDATGDQDDDDESVESISFEQMVSAALRDGEQWRFMPTAPPLDASLLGKYVAVRVSNVGWCVGRVSGRSAHGTKSYNFKVT